MSSPYSSHKFHLKVRNYKLCHKKVANHTGSSKRTKLPLADVPLHKENSSEDMKLRTIKKGQGRPIFTGSTNGWKAVQDAIG